MEPRPRLNTLLPSIALTIATLGVPACAQIEQIEAHNRAIVRATQVAPHTDDGTKIREACNFSYFIAMTSGLFFSFFFFFFFVTESI